MLKTFASFIAAVSFGAAGAAAYAATTHGFDDQDRQGVRDIFLRRATAATHHDIVAFEDVLASAAAGQPDPVVLVARTHRLWGKAAPIDEFTKTSKGVWKFVPDVDSIKIVPLSADVAELYATVQITRGASAASSETTPFLVYEVAVRTPRGWRIASIVPVSAR